MVNVDEIIGSLLLRHNCVIIPGFGGFVAKQTSAQIDYKSGLISPPRKSLLFNRQLVNNDGLLITEYARHNAIDYAASDLLVNQMILNWNKDLNEGSRVSIDKVGYLFFDQERNICFEQDKEFNLLLSSYGLGSVHFLSEVDVAILQSKTQEATNKIEEEVQIHVQKEEPVLFIKTVDESSTPTPTTVIGVANKQTNSTKSNFWKYAAAACLIPILFYSMWIPMKTDVLESKMISFQDFNPFHQHEQAKYNQTSIVPMLEEKQEEIQSLENQLNAVDAEKDTYSYNLTEKTFVLVQASESKDAILPAEIVESIQPDVNKVIEKAGNLSLIVGCFSDETNANNLVETLKSKGFNASIKDFKNGLHRVSIGSVNSESEMTVLDQKAKQLGFTGWILK